MLIKILYIARIVTYSRRVWISGPVWGMILRRPAHKLYSITQYIIYSVFQEGPDGRISGPVCGQDPQYCTAPLSSYTNTWPDEITR